MVLPDNPGTSSAAIGSWGIELSLRISGGGRCSARCDHHATAEAPRPDCIARLSQQMRCARGEQRVSRITACYEHRERRDQKGCLGRVIVRRADELRNKGDEEHDRLRMKRRDEEIADERSLWSDC